MFAIETVAVLGGSEGGTACAVAAALAGCAVRLHDAGAGALDRAADALRRQVERARAEGALTRADAQRVLDGVLFTADLDEAVTGADLVVDAGSGAPGLCERLAGALRASAAVASAGATAAEELAARLPNPGRVLELRLAASGGAVPRLDVVSAAGTSAHVLALARAFAARANAAADANRSERLPSPPPAVRAR